LLFAILLLAGGAGLCRPPAEAALLLRDTVLATDTVWQGLVTIEGVVVVAKGATLRIKPGAVILFRRIDRNGDGIGDSELRVLGRLIAQGTREQTIRFRSAESEPLPTDWSYLLLFASGRTNVIRFCEMAHAHTGLQIHFSTAVVSDCLFEHNKEAIRFGRAALLLEHNTMRNNDIGIRFTRMEGPVEIKKNQITQNRLGLFIVPSGQNIMDFFEPDRETPWNTGRLLVQGNNIQSNEWYDVSLGEKQMWDLDLAGNWWGTREAAEIEARFFDFHRDESLGRIHYQPAASRPFRDAGIRGDR